MRDRVYALTLLRGPRDWLTLAAVCLFAALVPLVVRLPLPRLAALLTRPTRNRTPQRSEIDRLERVVTLAPRVCHPVVRSGCLTRGLTLFWFLRRAGLDVELLFGLDPHIGESVDGHCWLTLNGEPYLEPTNSERFSELYRLPLPRPA